MSDKALENIDPGSIKHQLGIAAAPTEAAKKESGTGLRYDAGKAMVELLSPIAMEGVAVVLTFGAKKYAANNWRKGMAWSRVIGSLLRHTFKFMMGEDYDYDENCEGCKSKTCLNHSGLPHVDQIACNAMFLQEYFRTHRELDDRYKK